MQEKLSQSEIEALLSQRFNSVQPPLSSEEKDAIAELCNISLQNVRVLLEGKTSKTVLLSPVSLLVQEGSAAPDFDGEEALAYQMTLGGGISGEAVFAISRGTAAAISDLLLGGTGTAEGDEHADENIIGELAKEIAAEFAKGLGSVMNTDITADDTKKIDTAQGLPSSFSDGDVMHISAALSAVGAFDGKIIFIISLSLAREILGVLLDAAEEDPTPTDGENRRGVAKPVIFPSFDDAGGTSAPPKNIDFIMDVPLQLVVELGRTKKTIGEILELNIGSIVELDNLVEEQVKIFANGKLVAKGEVIVIDENFGVRITEVFTRGRTAQKRDNY